MKNGNRTLEEHGKKQGQRLLAKYGPEHFVKMGKLSMQKQLAKDPDIFKKRGRAGAEARRKKDPRYMEKMLAKRFGKEVKKTALEVLLGK